MPMNWDQMYFTRLSENKKQISVFVQKWNMYSKWLDYKNYFTKNHFEWTSCSSWYPWALWLEYTPFL